MTANQIAYWGHNEQRRHNKRTERETERHNRATEAIQSAQVGVNMYIAKEQARHNLVVEDVQIKTQVANAEHLNRQDAEVVRHNQEVERISDWQAQIAESNLALAKRKQYFNEWEASQRLLIEDAKLENEVRRTAIAESEAAAKNFANIGRGLKSVTEVVTTVMPLLSKGK